MDLTRLTFIASAVALMLIGSFGFGLYSGSMRNSVFNAVKSVKDNLELVYDDLTGQGDEEFLYSKRENFGPPIVTAEGATLAPGLIFFAGARENDSRSMRVIDRTGRVIHEWTPDWFEVWGDRGDFLEFRRPKTRQPLIHGAEIHPNGDVIFNFTNLSTVRMSPCGEVIWALENSGHHSVFIAEDDTIWISRDLLFDAPNDKYVNFANKDYSNAITQLSPEGVVLQEFEVYDILKANDLLGLMYMSTLNGKSTKVRGDVFHLNDVEVYPSDMPSELFNPGDIMFSLRNINAIFVFDPTDLKVKFMSVGKFLRQHDPEFMPDDKIAVFDNRNIWPALSMAENGSRIVEIDARNGEARVIVDGQVSPKFFAREGGELEDLPNGGYLFTMTSGRLFETDRDGAAAWEFHNRLPDGRNGSISSVSLLPPEMDEAFFRDLQARCP